MTHYSVKNTVIPVLLGAIALGTSTAAIASPNASLQTQQNTVIAGRLRPTRHPSRPISGPNKLTPSFSAVGNWSGNMHSKGDDVLAHFQLAIPSGQGAVKQGTWKLMGGNGVMAQGPATITVQGSTVKLDFQNYYGKTIQLQGSFQNGGQKIAGHQVNNPNQVFAFTK